MVLAGQIERFDAIAGADRVIAVRLQQIVEELHVELVILHNHHGLGHPGPLAARRPQPMTPTGPRAACPGMCGHGRKKPSADVLGKRKRARINNGPGTRGNPSDMKEIQKLAAGRSDSSGDPPQAGRRQYCTAAASVSESVLDFACTAPKSRALPSLRRAFRTM